MRSKTSGTVGSGKQVYVIGPLCGPYKIGWTGGLEARLNQLRVDNWVDIRVIMAGFGGEELEKEIHRSYWHKRIRGEWFNLSDEDLEEIADELGVIFDVGKMYEEFDVEWEGWGSDGFDAWHGYKIAASLTQSKNYHKNRGETCAERGDKGVCLCEGSSAAWHWLSGVGR